MNIYEYQRPVGKIEDMPELRNGFIAVYESGDLDRVKKEREKQIELIKNN